MIHFLSNNHIGCWRSVMIGPNKPMVRDTKTDNLVVKDPHNYTEEDYQKLELDAKAHALLAMALPNEIYYDLLHHESTKDLWDDLKEQFGRTTEVIANTKEFLAQQYETFSKLNS
ncbi:hypothetical protein R6Q59_007433 [Mikania micrantha]